MKFYKAKTKTKRMKSWEYRFGNIDRHICPSCNNYEMIRDATIKNTKIGIWECEHIFKRRYNNGDMYDNLIPICKTCNTNNKPYDTMYDYMVIIKTITREEADIKKQELEQLLKTLQNNKNALLCIALTQKGDRCTKNKDIKSLFCGQHKKNETYHINEFIKRDMKDWQKIIDGFPEITSSDEEYLSNNFVL